MKILDDTLLIAGLEARHMFRSPMAYVAGAVLQLILAVVFFSNLASFEAAAGGVNIVEAVIRPLFFSAGTILLLTAPLLTMHLISEEYQQGTFTILLASPVSMTALAAGKFLGSLSFMVFLIVLFATMPVGLMLFAEISFIDITVCIMAALLYVLPLTAIGLYTSSLSARPFLAAMGAFGILLVLWLGDLPRHSAQNWLAVLSDHISIMSHYEGLLLGLITPADLGYMVLLALFFILLTIRRLHNLRTLP